jgi:mersacidin/lichenicidin family type 2 lantibiotic
MSPEQIVRAWKDADYDAALSASTGISAPPSPVGRIDLPDPALDVAGGDVAMRTEYLETLGCCQGFTQPGKCDVTAALLYCTQLCITIFWSHWDWCQ